MFKIWRVKDVIVVKKVWEEVKDRRRVKVKILVSENVKIMGNERERVVIEYVRRVNDKVKMIEM